MTLRSRLILAFLAATLAPLAVTLWVTSSLLEHSLQYSSTRELEEVTKSLELTGREFYQREREHLRSTKQKPEMFGVKDESQWPSAVREFWESGEAERFLTAGDGGDRLELLVRKDGAVWRYSESLGAVGMARLTEQIGRAREVVEASRNRDLRRGVVYTFVVLAAAVWAVSLVLLVFSAHRLATPIQRLTRALRELADGDPGVRVEAHGDGEVAKALEAFNHMAEQLQHSREKLVFVTRLASWQALGRKMAHELKNSLTPIRLTAEELAAHADSGVTWIQQAAQIIVDESHRLERRVRAFSELAAEPPVHLVPVDVNAMLEERFGFLRNAHPEVIYNLRLAAGRPVAMADEDLIRAVMTNLLENAADAAGAGGVVLASSVVSDGKVWLEVHDSGPGLSMHARNTLFEPTISFKRTGMGLGLSIARKSALLSGGDIIHLGREQGELGGAAFRVILPLAQDTQTKTHAEQTSLAG